MTKMIDLLAIDLSKPPSPCDPPLPDYQLFLADGRSIGLEVTEAQDPDVAAAWNGTLEQFKLQIKKSLERDGAMARVFGSVFMDALIDLRGAAAVKAAANEVAAVIKKTLPAGLRPTSGSKFPSLPFLTSLEVVPAANVEVHLGAAVHPHGPGLIQLAIDKKVSRLDGYRGLAASEYWLLVVGGAAMAGVTLDDANSHTFASPFDKTIFLDDGDEICDYLTTLDEGHHAES